MGVMTKAEYIESLRKLHPTAYMFGEKITNVVDNPRLRAGIEATGATYELAELPEYRDMMIAHSPWIDEPVNRFNLPPMSIEDLVYRVKINRALGNYVGTCHQRCTGMDCMCSLAIVGYDVDRKYGTNYYDRVVEFIKYMQKNDFTANASVTDVKGDRSLPPKDQHDKDVYLHVVEKKNEGIVVRGAKAHQTGSLSCHELIVLPTRALRKGEEEFAVAFAIPADTEGVVHVVG
ncbi:MAG: 4-hydroxybutyryl-CoA dehydratase, partial [Deltaproteobacteria bacterium]|nr:4-hydroxybutyryl-CoA dehydratase [Deltaproteobacteria bacterium]